VRNTANAKSNERTLIDRFGVSDAHTQAARKSLDVAHVLAAAKRGEHGGCVFMRERILIRGRIVRRCLGAGFSAHGIADFAGYLIGDGS
jgi:hypothetical protein